MYLDHYKDKLLEKISKLERKVALYESDDVIAAMNAACDQRIRGAEAREQRNYRSWMNAAEKNKELKSEITSLRNERATLRSESKKLRKQNNRLKKETDRLQDLNKTVIEQRDKEIREKEEKDKQIEALKEEVRRLQALIDHDGETNGIPTSQTPIGKKKIIPNTRPATDRNKGGQKGHEKHSMKAHQEDEITDRQEHLLDQCPYCGGELEPEGDAVEKDETDYEVRVIKKRHRFPKYRCRKCGRIVRAMIPKQLKEANQYGANIQAMILALVDLGFISINRTRKITIGMLGGKLKISEGYVGKIQKKAADYTMSHPTGKIRILGAMEDGKLLFQYKQAKDSNLIGRIFSMDVGDDAWLPDEPL